MNSCGRNFVNKSAQQFSAVGSGLRLYILSKNQLQFSFRVTAEVSESREFVNCESSQNSKDIDLNGKIFNILSFSTEN